MFRVQRLSQCSVRCLNVYVKRLGDVGTAIFGLGAHLGVGLRRGIR